MPKSLAMTDKRVTARRQALALGVALVLLGGCATQRVIAPPPTLPGAKAAYHSITTQPAHLAAVTAHQRPGGFGAARSSPLAHQRQFD